jgi:hypothetical protein
LHCSSWRKEVITLADVEREEEEEGGGEEEEEG